MLKSIREYSPLDDACWSFGEPAPYMHLAQAFAVSRAEQAMCPLANAGTAAAAVTTGIVSASQSCIVRRLLRLAPAALGGCLVSL